MKLSTFSLLVLLALIAVVLLAMDSSSGANWLILVGFLVFSLGQGALDAYLVVELRNVRSEIASMRSTRQSTPRSEPRRDPLEDLARMQAAQLMQRAAQNNPNPLNSEGDTWLN